MSLFNVFKKKTQPQTISATATVTPAVEPELTEEQLIAKQEKISSEMQLNLLKMPPMFYPPIAMAAKDEMRKWFAGKVKKNPNITEEQLLHIYLKSPTTMQVYDMLKITVDDIRRIARKALNECK